MFQRIKNIFINFFSPDKWRKTKIKELEKTNSGKFILYKKDSENTDWYCPYNK